jgi:ATP-dependent protease HslVU (ClpYQ) peptidase subunit
MSVIVAKKQDGIVYMGADTLRSTGTFGKHCYAKDNLKITSYENGIIFGHVGSVRTSYLFYSNSEIFTLDNKGKLTKKHIVEKIIPILIDIACQANCIDEKEKTLENAFLLAFENKLFLIGDDFAVYDLDFCAIGSGGPFAYPVLYTDTRLDVKESLICAMEQSAIHDRGVERPFVLINTKDLELEFVK